MIMEGESGGEMMTSEVFIMAAAGCGGSSPWRVLGSILTRIAPASALSTAPTGTDA